MSTLSRAATGLTIALFSAIGLAVLGLVVLLSLAATANYWAAEWRFPPAGTPKGEIARLAWVNSPDLAWTDPPTDLSGDLCPLVDDALRAEIAASPGPWGIALGTSCWSERRNVVIGYDNETGECRATVFEPIPECSL